MICAGFARADSVQYVTGIRKTSARLRNARLCHSSINKTQRPDARCRHATTAAPLLALTIASIIYQSCCFLDSFKLIPNHPRAMSRYETTTTEELRSRGLRVTAARRAVLEWLVSHPHATVEHVHSGVLEHLGTISKQAVYDVLSACVNAGLVRQIKPSGHPARFERRTDDNHHHLVCRSCGRIVDTDCGVGQAPCMHPEHDHGFAIDEAEVVFWGLCSDCQTQPIPDTTKDCISTSNSTGSTDPS